MINNESQTSYTEYKKIYIPEEYNSENYKYTLSGDEITIITNQNCYTNYNSTYCDCYRYNEKYNIITESYSCNNNPSNYIINYDNISSNVNDSYRITRDYVNEYTILFGTMIIAILITTLFKRNSRNI